MIKKISTFITLLLLLCCTFCSGPKRAAVAPSFQQMEAAFRKPPASQQTSVYWYWMSDNISKEGVVKDLQAMKRVGINRAFIGNIGYDATPYGKIKLFSDEWWEILHTALKTASALDIEIGIFNSPGWSQSGGPWIKPAQAMRYLASSELAVSGPQELHALLPKPNEQFQDVRVIAFPAPESWNSSLSDAQPKITSDLRTDSLNVLSDRNTATEVPLRANHPFYIQFETNTAYTARSVSIYPGKKRMKGMIDFQVAVDTGYQTLRRFLFDRSNPDLHVGFDPFGPVVVSVPATTARRFRLLFSNTTPAFGVAEINISAAARQENWVEKTLGKMFQTPLPYWQEYQWPRQPALNDARLAIDPASVLDISSSMKPDGTLHWQVPAGRWIIQRTGMTPTGQMNGPASPEGTGLEVDKMSREHVSSHFDAFLGEIIRRIPARDRRTWRVAVEDSYETGGQNWTDGLADLFKKTYGYDPNPYLPVFKGYVVGSPDRSDRFLWDVRRLVADRVAYDYVGGLREVSHRHGLTTWLENYGHWGFPGEFLQYGGQSDEIGGEFWSEGELGNIENRAASSAAHIYGKTKVSAESFTAGGKSYARYPALMKQRGDRFFTEGINNTLLHVFIEQPTDSLVPGINADFGNEFNRHNTWFSYLDLFTGYLKRSNYLLQQGTYVADVAYFIGEDAPKMTGITQPALPAGYSFDYINAEVIRNRLGVRDGRLVLPDGMSYNLLVLPPLQTMRPELLKKMEELVMQGAAILGPAPSRSPSLQNYPAADETVKQIAARLWGTSEDTTGIRTVGKGQVLWGMNMQTALDHLHIPPDCRAGADSVLFIHRRTHETDVYMVSNQSNQTIRIEPRFRVSGKAPRLWDAVTGATRALGQFTAIDATTTVPLVLAPLQSHFIVFQSSAATPSGSPNFPEQKELGVINTPWQVNFLDKKRGPQQPVLFPALTDWTQHSQDAIRYYAGKAIYTNSFTAPAAAKNQRIMLDLGDVKVMAKVNLNGQYAGGLWTAPWQLDITDLLKPGENGLEIEVVNTWVNRLIGDSRLPEAQRSTWTNFNPYKPDSPLEPSGLKGPVRLMGVVLNKDAKE